MLYVDINNKNQTYTAFRALTDHSLDVIPLRLPAFTEAELDSFCGDSFAQTTAKILNLFFNVKVKNCDIDQCLNKNALVLDNLDRKTLLVKLVQDSDKNVHDFINDIYNLMDSQKINSLCWAQTAIRISLLFGLYSDLRRCGIFEFDVAVFCNEMLDLNPVVYARKMGLPIRKIVCGSIYEDDIWMLQHTGRLNEHATGIDAFIYACSSEKVYSLTDNQISELNSWLYTDVVSVERAKDIISKVSSTFNKSIDNSCAIAYGALQDFRSVTGENSITLVFSK